MPQYPETKLDKAINKAISVENAAVEAELKTGEFQDTPARQWFRELIEDEKD
jgi:hypothetical protein